MKVHTENSVYELDLVNKRYRRTADKPVENSGNLSYGEWHDMVSFDIQKTLVIHYPESECGAAKAGVSCRNQHRIETSFITKVEIDGA